MAFFQFGSLQACRAGWLNLRGTVIEAHVVMHEGAYVIGVRGSPSSVESARRAVGKHGHCIARGLEATTVQGLPECLSQSLREIAEEFRDCPAFPAMP